MTKINRKEKVHVALMITEPIKWFEAKYGRENLSIGAVSDKKDGYESRSKDSEQRLAAMRKAYLYNPSDFTSIRFLETDRYRVILEEAKSYEQGNLVHADIALLGNYTDMEERAIKAKGTGLIVARYSIFYKYRSDYSGNYPQQSGYSIDIPKRVATAKALLMHEPFLEGILARDEQKIVDAIGGLNQALDQPVLVTPYLHTALSCNTKETRDMVVGRRNL